MPAKGAVEIANSEVPLALIDSLSSSGDIDGSLLVGAGPVMGERRLAMRETDGERDQQLTS